MSHRFTEACDGCSACVRQCPTGAIFGVSGKRYDVDPAACVDCHVCGWICPAGAVRDEVGQPVVRIARDLRPRPVIDASRCNGCALCTAACPFDCRQVVGPVFAGLAMLRAPERCVSCGECSRACIKGAITMRSVDIRGYLPRQERERLWAVLDEGESL